jgi:hypothetical protein
VAQPGPCPATAALREIGAWKILSFKVAVVFRRNLIFEEHMYPDFLSRIFSVKSPQH